MTVDRESDAAAPLWGPLDAFGRGDVAVAGGKGANLGELVRAGFAVPTGFVLTTRAYDLVAGQGELAQRLAALAAVDPSDMAELEAAGRELREAFEQIEVPAEVAEAVRGAAAGLGEGPVAVRSSATAEDLPGAAFAGQQETFLNVVGEEAVLDAVRRCWGSLWTERAIAYRVRLGIEHAAVKLAVVVQRLVPADVAGVAFTSNPVTGARDELVIDASPGLGEAVVSGAVTPDHYVLKKRTYAVVERRVGRREVVIRAAAGGGTEVSRRGDGAPMIAPALAANELRELGRLVEAVERHFSAPQDIEWALAGGRVWVLQSRPITALPREGTGSPANGQGRRKRRRFRPPNFAGELLPARPYPLDATSHMRVMLDALQESMTGPLGVRFPTVEQLLQEEDGLPVRASMREGVGPSWRVLYRPWLSLWERRGVDVTRWDADPVIAEATRRARALERRDLTGLSWEEVLGTFHEALDLIPYVLTLRKRYLILAVRDAALLWLLLRAAGQHRHFGALLSGVENKTLEINRALEELAEVVRSTPELRRVFAETPAAELATTLSLERGAQVQAFRERFERFLEEYGNREEAILLLSLPTWKDNPSAPLGIIKSLTASPPAPRSEGPPEWERARDALLAHSILGKGPLRGVFLRRLERARVFPRLREDSHFYIGLAHTPERRSALELGRRLAAAGAVDEAEDVFLLRLKELEALGRAWPPPDATVRRLRATVEDRRKRRTALADVPVVEVNHDDAPEAVEGALLTGTPGSAGVAEGRVRLIRGPAEFGRLETGDVLVAPFTNPSWTPLFSLAQAVVVDTGAAMSHAAIVAREYGIPAVMGAAGATATLRDGQWVRVDGSRGAVFAAEHPEEGRQAP
jgi:pyruvate,water dikinase